MESTIKPATQDFQFVGGSLALDFVNTVGNRLGQSRDYFTAQSEVVSWARLAGVLHTRQLPVNDPYALSTIRQARETLYGAFQLLAQGRRISDAMLAPLNALIEKHLAKRRLALIEGGVQWQWTTLTGDVDQILTPVLSDATELLVSGNFRKLKQCEDDACGWLFLDRSQARRRRWCSMADCGNRAKVRRYYRERRNTGTSHSM